MADIAKLGFSVDTKPVDDATVSLNKLVPAAKNAENASKGFVAAINGVKGTTGALGQAASGMAGLSTASLRAGSAMGAVQSAAVGATGAIRVLGLAGARQGPPTALWDAYRASLLKVPAAANGAKTSLDRLGASANDNINRLQSTPGNIAAQFQDIGVTAAGGMNPLLIALQQGTQLSAAMQGGIGNLLAGIGQLFNATTILTIGLVALGAALLQNIDWTQLGVSALNMLADVMEAAAPYALALGAVLALAFAPQIISAVYSLVVAIGTALVGAIVSATTALWALALANPFTAIILAVAATIAAFVYFGKATVESVKEPINFIIGGFVGAFNTVKKTWSMLPAAMGDAAISAVNVALGAIENLINGSSQRLNAFMAAMPPWVAAFTGITGAFGGVKLGRLDNPYAGTRSAIGGIAGNEMGAAQGVDYVGKIQGAVVAGANYLVDKVRGLASSLGAGKDKKDKGAKDAASGGKTDGEKFSDIVTGAENDIAKEIARGKAVQLTAIAAATLEQKQKLLNEAMTKGIALTDPMRTKIDQLSAAYGVAKVEADRLISTRKLEENNTAGLEALKAEAAMIGLYGRELAYATEYAKQFAAAKAEFKNDPDGLAAFAKGIPASVNRMVDQSEGNKRAKMMEDLRRESELSTFANQRELESIGLTTEALIAHDYATEKLLQAKRDGIALGPQDIATITATGEAYAAQITMINNTRAALDFVRDGVKGFVSDLRGGLEQGKNFFSAFGDSVLNILNKIIDKLVDVALNAALGGGGSSSGFLGAIAKVGASLLGGGGSGMSIDNPDLAGIFAKGGSFTNGIVDSPTLFKFAKGTGMMGEAGPEAIMPLKRGANGSLGVQVVGANDNRGASAAPVININNSYVINGSSTADMQATVRQSAEQTKDQLRREIPSVINEFQRNGTIG